MSYSKEQYDRAAKEYLHGNPFIFEKYGSGNSELIMQIADEMMKSSLPTLTAARIALDRLIRAGNVARTDGRTDADDNARVIAAARANLDKVIAEAEAEPLLKSDLEYFGSLDQKTLAKLYWEDDGLTEFGIKYRKASTMFGFVIPEKPVQEANETSGSDELTLTAAEYHAMPAAVMQKRMRDVKFKQQVYMLIKAGKI